MEGLHQRRHQSEKGRPNIVAGVFGRNGLDDGHRLHRGDALLPSVCSQGARRRRRGHALRPHADHARLSRLGRRLRLEHGLFLGVEGATGKVQGAFIRDDDPDGLLFVHGLCHHECILEVVPRHPTWTGRPRRRRGRRRPGRGTGTGRRSFSSSCRRREPLWAPPGIRFALERGRGAGLYPWRAGSRCRPRPGLGEPGARLRQPGEWQAGRIQERHDAL
mmetsp:Transcript_14174/g.49836  ORF Transcript_14174/g.49836 Transcript_14174/m.49836 type:complete len:219 (+) Transcript_14174:572-1228(+)